FGRHIADRAAADLWRSPPRPLSSRRRARRARSASVGSGRRKRSPEQTKQSWNGRAADSSRGESVGRTSGLDALTSRATLWAERLFHVSVDLRPKSLLRPVSAPRAR